MSHTKVYDTLTKPVLPTKGAVEMITEVLAEKFRGADVNAEIDRLLSLWQEASLDASLSSHSTFERSQGEASPPTDGSPFMENEEENTQSDWGNPWQQHPKTNASEIRGMGSLDTIGMDSLDFLETQVWLRQAADADTAIQPGVFHQHAASSSSINAQTEAELVQVVCSFNSGVDFSITNNGSRPVRNVELVHLARADAPGESWKLNPNAWGARSRWDILRPGEEKQTLTWLLDAQGRQISDRNEIRAVVYTVRFLDYEGQWWERTPSGARQVPPPA
ncbi:hypothetical protein [Nocardiopsis dassonvillei]|uniref:hypothetical protein n=1 Tax=Nocardiopsis dassonvillei TaxID=2014 RepID=UPI00366BEF66